MCADIHSLPSESSTYETHEPKKAVKPLKLKRGDRVRLLADHDYQAKAGMIGTVVNTKESFPLLRIESKGFLGHGANGKQWYVPVSKLRVMRKRSTSVKATASKSVKRTATRSSARTV